MIVSKLKNKFKISLLLILFSASALAQGNLPYADGKFIHFGFSLGLNAMDFNVTPTTNDSVRVSGITPGFSVGVISDMRLFRYLNLRFTPTLHLGERKIDYSFTSGDENISVNSILVSIPAYFKFSAERKDNYRPYLIWGGGVYIDMARNKDKPVLLKPTDVFTEFGVGCDIYFSFFKLAPELKFAIGFNNMLTPYAERTTGNDPDNYRLSTPIEKLTTKMLTLSFNFE